jgi:uncharacterized protein YndB with AHSA1/START domain
MSDIPSLSADGLYDGIMERTADGGVIRFERHLAYPVRDVWDAITDPARLADRWLPFDADIAVDLRVGGPMVMAATGDEPMTITSTILRVEAPSSWSTPTSIPARTCAGSSSRSRPGASCD